MKPRNMPADGEPRGLQKMSVEDIRARFDADVERFSNLDTGQVAIVDAPLVLDLVTRAAAAVTPRASDLLDIGCGAGNYTLKLLGLLPDLNVTLVDLSRPMIERALERVRPHTTGALTAHQTDVRVLDIGEDRFDIVMAAAVLHHLRTDIEWEAVLTKIYRGLRPGGGFWIADLVAHTQQSVQELMEMRYAAYLDALGGEAYRNEILRYIEAEDTPKSLMFQVELLRRIGFSSFEILHKNSCFAAFGAVKS